MQLFFFMQNDCRMLCIKCGKYTEKYAEEKRNISGKNTNDYFARGEKQLKYNGVLSKTPGKDVNNNRKNTKSGMEIDTMKKH